MIRRTYRLIAVFSLLVAIAIQVHGVDEFTMLVPPVKDGGVKAMREFFGADGALNLAYEKAYPDRPSEFFHLRYVNGTWSSPRLIPVSHPNARSLRGVVTLTNGTSLLLMNSDDTDYARAFNLGANPALDQNGVPVGIGLSPERFRQLLIENQRLFYSLQVGGKWTVPMPIPDSTLVSEAVLAAGDDGSALVVFARDGDKRAETLSDNELYATVYQNHAWTRPVRLTSNTVAEHSVQAQFVNGKYLVVWVADQDGNLSDRSDSTLDYAVVSPFGAVAKAASAAISGLQNNPVPVLGRDGPEAVLLWTSTLEAGKPERAVWEARFGSGVLGASWSKATDTGLRTDYLLGASTQKRAEGLLLLYKDKGLLNAALKAGGKWNRPAAVRGFNMPLQLSSYRLFTDQQSQMWITAAANVTGGAGEATDTGLYEWHAPLGADLAIQFAGEKPLRKLLGKEATVTWKVTNRGTLPSSVYRSEVLRDGKVAKAMEGIALAPGESQEFEYTAIIQEAQTPLELRVTASGDGHLENNTLARVLEVLPDFEVRSVSRGDATHYTADIVERKGIAAPPVTAEFLLVENGQQSLVAKGEFDPSSGVPLTVRTNQLVDKTGPYQLLVRLNTDHKVKEDDYSNNQSAYNHRLQADFEISRFYVTTDEVQVTVRNRGTQPAASVEVLLTDNPLLVGGNAPGGGLWYYQAVMLDASGQAQIQLPRAGRPALEGENLYAVVNPYGKIPESDRNNNTQKTSLTNLAGAVPGGGSGGGSGGAPGSALDFSKVAPWCSSLVIEVSNGGTEAALGARVELVTSGGIVAAVEALPVVIPSTTQSVTFQNLSAGAYTLRLISRLADGTEQSVTRQAAIRLAENCASLAGNDIRVIDVQRESQGEFVQISVSVGAVGYELDYRKPLLRVPVELEVKQGIRSLYHETREVYLAGGESENVANAAFAIESERLPAGTLQFIARVPVRDDETKAANNLGVAEFSVGE